jgi:hypothetical protein
MAMPGILAEVNVEGHVEWLRRILEDEPWKEAWCNLAAPIHTFTDVGLADNAPDTVVAIRGDQDQLARLAELSNDEGPDSLKAAIRTWDAPDSLPVFTLADAERFRRDKTYADLVAERFLEYLLDIEKYRGTGRLYLP